MWQGYGIPCVDAMKYFQEKEQKTLAEILDSDAVSDFTSTHIIKNWWKETLSQWLWITWWHAKKMFHVQPQKWFFIKLDVHLQKDFELINLVIVTQRKSQQSFVVCVKRKDVTELATISKTNNENQQTQSTLDQFPFTVENITLPPSDLSWKYH
jgi:hypothetical protein